MRCSSNFLDPEKSDIELKRISTIFWEEMGRYDVHCPTDYAIAGDIQDIKQWLSENITRGYRMDAAGVFFQHPDDAMLCKLTWVGK